MFGFGFLGTVERFQAEKTVEFKSKDDDSTVTLSELVDKSGLKDGDSFKLKPWLLNGDMQTIYLGIADFSKKFIVYYGRKILPFRNGGSTAIDFVLKDVEKEELFEQQAKENLPDDYPKLHPRTRFLSPDEIDKQHSTDNKPMVLVFHGLGGGSYATNTRSICDDLTKQHGFEAAVFHTRGCGGSKLTTPELYCGLVTDDVRDFVNSIRKTFPNRPLYGVGVSFGGALLSNYLAQEGDKSPFVACAALSSPWDFVDSSYRLDNRLISSLVFKSVIASYLTDILKEHRKELEGSSPIFTKEKIDKKYNSLVEFDNTFTAPFYGFTSAFDYYRAASPVQRLKHVRTPLLIINSTDDPIVGVQSIPTHEAMTNPYIIVARTDIGGHVAYVQSDNDMWAVLRIGEFFKTLQEHVDTTTKPNSSSYSLPTSRFASSLSLQHI